MMVRLHNDLLERLRDAGGRYRLTIAEIARRACRRWVSVGRVAELRNQEPATRANSTPIHLRNVPELVDAPALPVILDWYLRTHDKGGRNTGPSMSGFIRHNPDGSVTYCGPVDEETEREVNMA